MADVEKRWISKVTQGMRLKIPKGIIGMYKIQQGDMIEWQYNEKGKIQIAVKEMVLREKKAKIEGAKVERDKGKKG